MTAIAEALAVPLQVALALSQNHAQVVALAEVANLGLRLQQIVEIRLVHASAGNLSPLHALCADARSQRNSDLAPFLTLLGNTLAAYGRADAALAAQQAETLAALAAVGGQLAAHAQESGAEARRLAQHPLALELAIERQLLSSIQAELAQRAQVIAASSGSPGPLPPFCAALDQLKAEAAAALLHLERQRAQQAGQHAPQLQRQQEQQPHGHQLQQRQGKRQQLGQQQQPQQQEPLPRIQHAPPQQPQPAAGSGEDVAQGQPAAAVLQGGDVQLLASSMQGLAQQLQQLQTVLVGQQQQWQQQQELQAPLLHFLHQLVPPGIHLHPPGQQQQQLALLQWQQAQSPPPRAAGLQHAAAAGEPTGATTLRELSPAPPASEPAARQRQLPPSSAAPTAAKVVAAAAGPAGDPEPEALPALLAGAATLADAGFASAAADLMRAVSGEQAAAAADAALESGHGLLAALRGDAAPSSSSEDPAVAAAALAGKQAPSPQKTTASAPAAVGAADGSPHGAEQQEHADGRPAGAHLGFAFPQLEHPSQQGRTAATPALPADPLPQAVAAAAPAEQRSGGGGSGGDGGSLVGSPQALLAVAGEGPAGLPTGEGKENLTSSQSNSQEQLGLTPIPADVAPANKPPAACEAGGAARSSHAGQAGGAGTARVGQLACVVPDSEEQTLPGTQPFGDGSQPPLPPAAGAALSAPDAAVARPAADAAQPAQPLSPPQHRSQHELAVGATAAAAHALSAGVPTTQGTPAPSLAALLDSQRDSTSPKAVGRPGSTPQAAHACTAGAGGSSLAAAVAAASPVAAGGGSAAGRVPDSGGKQGGSSGSGSGVAPAAAAAPGLAKSPSQEQVWQAAGDGLQRKRPASQDAERWQQKRSRFGRESQEQQQQQEQPRAATGEPHQAADQAVEVVEAEQPQAQEQQEQAAAAVADCSDPQSSSGIICTQQPASDGGVPALAVSGLLAPPGTTAPPGLGSLAALRQLWQQQHGNASPLLPLQGTPGAAQLTASPWPAGSWQPHPVAGAQPGATPRFVSPSVQGSAGATPAGLTLPGCGTAAEAGPAGPQLGGNLFLSLLSMHASAAVVQQQGQQQQGQQQQAQHHRLARSSSPQQEEQPSAAALPTSGDCSDDQP